MLKHTLTTLLVPLALAAALAGCETPTTVLRHPTTG
jgi:outer membrane protein assembly factor BamE (lipoprotein component of BamABCDE complex)